MIDTDTEIETGTGTESEIESEFEDDVVAKAACGRRSGDGRGTMARLEGAEAQQDKLRRVGLMLRAMTS
jgi:hypothetical protein